jgi:hypothetical protein
MNGGSDFEFRKLPGFREAVKPRPVAGDRSHEATFFTIASGIFFPKMIGDVTGR